MLMSEVMTQAEFTTLLKCSGSVHEKTTDGRSTMKLSLYLSELRSGFSVNHARFMSLKSAGTMACAANPAMTTPKLMGTSAQMGMSEVCAGSRKLPGASGL